MKRFLIYVFFISIFGLCGCVPEASNSETVVLRNGSGKNEVRILRSEISELRKDMKVMMAKLDSLKPATAGGCSGCGGKKKAGGCGGGCGGKKKAGGCGNNRKTDATVYDITTEDSPVLGPVDAAVTITMFADFQCMYSIRENTKIESILKEYPDKVKFVFKHYLLAFHKKAKPAHVAAELAYIEKGSDGFWEMYNMIIAKPRELEVPVLRGYVESLGLDLATFDEILADEKAIDTLLSEDKAEAKKCKVSSTPTVFINGLKMANRDIESYKERIDQILAALENATDEGQKVSSTSGNAKDTNVKSEFANAKCPIMASPIHPDKVAENLIRDYKSQKIAFCCAGCPETWDKLSDLEKNAKLAKVSL